MSSISGLGIRNSIKSRVGGSKGNDSKPKEGWRGGSDTVSKWMGKDKNPSSDRSEYVSAPLSTLKDPSAFGPPPKHINYHGAAAVPNQTAPDRRGIGAPLSQEEIRHQRRLEEDEARQAEELARPAPPVPYRIDTTGLSTSHLPPPPLRTNAADGKSPTSISKPKPKPNLPPRLPPRQNSHSGNAPTPPPSYGAAIAEPPAHKGIMNQGSLNRLGAAGVSIPGFGIGGRTTETPPSPGISPSRTNPIDPQPSPGPSQLDELQSRFSRFGTSSPKPDSSAQGSTFAEKQAAIHTASSLRNDPSSVSLSDARNAASTANNFRQRHGDQVASGWKSATAVNQKYGISDKAAAYGAPSGRTSSPQIDHTESPMIQMQDNTTRPFKKTPPPPPKKKPGLGIVADAGTGPPPIPLSTKPKPPTVSAYPEQKDLDLDLKSLWFAKSPAQFPPETINQLPGSRGLASSSGWSSAGARKTHTFTGVIRHNTTLATTKFHLTWDASNPGQTVQEQQKHVPPPRSLTNAELETYRKQYSDRIARWCESKMGQQVGNGECWTLAADALTAIAAESRAHHEEPCMTSQGLLHGSIIFSFLPPEPPKPSGGVEAAGVARGDIIQFLSAHFKGKDGGQSWAGMPDHTAVVRSVERGGVLKVLEQNTGGVKKVGEGRYDFSELVAGEVRIFRVVGEGWIGPLEPSWP